MRFLERKIGRQVWWHWREGEKGSPDEKKKIRWFDDHHIMRIVIWSMMINEYTVQMDNHTGFQVVHLVKGVQVVQVVRVVRIISPGDMHSGNIWFLWSKPSNYWEKLGCHARDGRTNGGGGKWKIEQCPVGPETAIRALFNHPFSGSQATRCWANLLRGWTADLGRE